MGWEERGGNRYYYRKERGPGGSVRSVYVGKGEVGRITARLAESRRLGREQRRKRFEALRERTLRQRDRVRRCSRAARALRDATLLLNGYRTHRGQWRKARGWKRPPPPTIPAPSTGDCTEPLLSSVPYPAVMSEPREVKMPEGSAEMARVIKDTNTDDPDPEDVEALREILRERPNLWRHVMDLSQMTEGQLVRRFAGDNALLSESLKHGLSEMKRELGREDAPALERLLIDQVTLCWTHFHSMQQHYASFIEGSYNMREAEHLEDRVDAAQRRLLRAAKTLGRVRKMAGRAPLQVNIGGQQVNVAG